MSFKSLGDGLYVREGDRGKVFYERPIINGQRTYRKLLSRTEKEARKELTERRNEQARASLDLAPDPYAKTQKQKKGNATLGQIFEVYIKKCLIPEETKKRNVRSLCIIVKKGVKEHTEKTNQEIEQLPAKILTADLLRDFQVTLLQSAGDDKLKQDTAVITANSYRRQARSLFAEEMLQFYDGLLPATLGGFMGVKALPEPPKFYKMPGQEILQKIREEAPKLKETDPNAYRAYLLCFGCGLRRNEAASARWDWIEKHGERYVIRVQTTEDFRPKGRRERYIPMERTVFEELESLRAPAIPGQAEYILFGPKSTRYQTAFVSFGEWLVSLGWDRKKKAHEGRKIFGSLVTDQFGISAAQSLLGHSNIKTTAEYYVGQVKLPEVKIFG